MQTQQMTYLEIQQQQNTSDGHQLCKNGQQQRSFVSSVRLLCKHNANEVKTAAALDFNYKRLTETQVEKKFKLRVHDAIFDK